MADQVIRRGGFSDQSLLLELIREFYDIDGHHFDADRLQAALPPLLEDDRFGVVWLIGEPVCGYAVVTWSYSLESGGPDALLDEIYIRERGSGLGGRAMAAILEDLQRRGLTRMFLETERPNERVRRFYSRLGFVEEDSRWMVWNTQASGTH